MKRNISKSFKLNEKELIKFNEIKSELGIKQTVQMIFFLYDYYKKGELKKQKEENNEKCIKDIKLIKEMLIHSLGEEEFNKFIKDKYAGYKD